MKLVKMSLLAATLIASSAFAIDNVKVSGNAQLAYFTVDSDVAGAPDMFDKDASFADTSLHLGLTADLTEGVSAGISGTAVSTLGLENNLVSGTWSNAHGATANPNALFAGGVQVDDAAWIDEAWIAGTAFDTTAKLGRMQLDTPLVYSESWGVDTNTFEAAMLINESIPQTTLVGGYIGKSNGSANDVGGILNTLGAAGAGYVAEGGKFNTFYKSGAYAVGAVNNSWEPLTVQAWYYNVVSTATALWAQGDLNIDGILAGVQYVNIDGNTADNDVALGAMIGYEMKDVFTVKGAYTTVDDKGSLGGVNNLATTSGLSSLYTEVWWWYGTVSASGADTIALSGESSVAGIDLFAGVYNTTNDVAQSDLLEVAVTAGTDFGPLNALVAVIYDSIDDTSTTNADEAYTTLDIQLVYSF